MVVRPAQDTSNPRLPFRVCVGALILLIAGATAADTAAVDSDSEFDAIRIRVEELEERLASIRERKSGLVGELVEADYELELQRGRLAESGRRLERARGTFEALQVETGELERRLEAVRSSIVRRTRGLYLMGGRGALRLLLSARSGDSAMPALRALRYLLRRDAELRKTLRSTELELGRKLVAIEVQQRTILALMAEERSRLESLTGLRERRSRLLAEVERREVLVAAEVAGWAEREQRLGDLLDGVDLTAAGLGGREIQEFKGVLDRPMTGTVIRGFGPQRDPRYATEVPHNGLRFSGLEGERVRVVYPGRVLYAESLEGYGPTVVVQHPGRVFTLYAGLERLSVVSDELLSIGQEIGVSDGGLYFEVRVDNRAVDPEPWIR